MVLVLGAGLAGLSVAYHLGHDRCVVLEKQAHAFGHVASEQADGYTWDEGPHVSFTKSSYVRDLFAKSVEGDFDEYEVRVGNYWRGHWIEHPAQTALYQVPQPLRDACLASFLASRQGLGGSSAPVPPADYMTWLEAAFGPVFAHSFPAAYTRKYWTVDPRELTTDWIGDRVLYPTVDDVVRGSAGPLDRSKHYISRVRYPRRGGFQRFASSLHAGAVVRYGAEVTRIDLAARTVQLAGGETLRYETLVNTLPLPVFVECCVGLPDAVLQAAAQLTCSQLLLVNVMAPHPTRRPENWMYVYDEDMLTTRINTTEKLTPGNAPAGRTGVQVEVYSSKHRPATMPAKEAGRRVLAELASMGLVDEADPADPRAPTFRLRECAWANVVFDHTTRSALDTVLSGLEAFGLHREADDLHPMTRWDDQQTGTDTAGSLALAGRFGQWKYFWTDDCVLRGRQLAEALSRSGR